MADKRNIKALIEKEAPNLNNLLDPEEVKIFKNLTDELRDTWTKKQMFRTETEMQFSVLNDAKYPTKAAKYWQCVREQNVFLENLMQLSFDYRRAEVKQKRLEQKLEKEIDPLKKELLQIDIDEKTYQKAGMQLVARDRMREIKLWSKFKKKFDDGSFDNKDVNTHQLNSYHLIMKNKAETLTEGSSQPEVFNVLGQLQSIERIKKDLQIENQKKDFEAILNANKEMNELIGKLKTDFAELDKRFNKKNRDVGLLAIEKTKAVERITNAASDKANRCIEIASGSPLTEKEINATKKSEINTECPSIANPNYIPY